MKALGYEVFVECKCSSTHITQVVAGVCSGPAGASGQCVHVASVLIAAVNCLRPRQTDFSPPSTSGLCWWNRPSAGNMYSFLRPVCYIPFSQEDINKPEKKQSRPCMVSSLWRNNFNPWPDHVTLFARDCPVMQEKSIGCTSTRRIHVRCDELLAGLCNSPLPSMVDKQITTIRYYLLSKPVYGRS